MKKRKEVYKPITGFENYSISNDGNVISNNIYNHKSGRKLKPILQTDGYLHFTLCRDAKKHQVVAHRLVGIMFIPNPENKPHINHKNGIKSDNRVENLEWCTRSENTTHAFKTGLMKSPKYWENKKGKLHHRSKKLKVVLHDGTYVATFHGTAEAARKLNLSQAYVSNCCLKQRRHKKYKFYYI